MTRTDRFRPVDVRMPFDAKFRALSAPAPNAQTLFERLLYSGFDRSIPGLHVAGIGTFADRLAWPYDDTARCWLEVENQGLAELDRTAGIIWTPNAIHHRPPTSPQQVKGWGRYWNEIPECPLKLRAWNAVVEWFDEAIAAAVVEEEERNRARRRKQRSGQTNTQGSSQPKSKKQSETLAAWRELFIERCAEPDVPEPFFDADPVHAQDRKRPPDDAPTEPQGPVIAAGSWDEVAQRVGIRRPQRSPQHVEVAHKQEREREHDLDPPPLTRAREREAQAEETNAPRAADSDLEDDQPAKPLWVLDEWNRRPSLPRADRDRDPRVEPALLAWCRRGVTRRLTQAYFDALASSDWTLGRAPGGPSEAWTIGDALTRSEDTVLKTAAGHLRNRAPSNPEAPAAGSVGRKRAMDVVAEKEAAFRARSAQQQPARPDHGAGGEVIDLNSSEWSDTEEANVGEQR